MPNDNEQETRNHAPPPANAAPSDSADAPPSASADAPASALIQALAGAVATHRLYPVEHPSSVNALAGLVAAMDPLFREDDRLRVETEKDALTVNGHPVTRPPAMVNWLSDQLRRRLIKAVIISAQVEPAELAKLCLLFTGRIEGTDLREERRQLDEVRCPNLEILELEYRDAATAAIPRRTVVEEDWRLAMYQTADAVVLPPEANILANRLEQMSLMHGYEEDAKEVDVFRMLAQAAADTFNEALPDDSYKMELLMTHIVGALDDELQHEFRDTSTFRRRQVLGMAAQRILKRTPDLIVSIAEHAGPLLPQIQARSRGRSPGEMLTHLFMRTDRASEEVEQTVAKVTESPEEKQRSTPLDPVALLAKVDRLGTKRETAPAAVDKNEVTHHYVVFLATLVGRADAPEKAREAREALGRFVTEEMDARNFKLARDVAGILEGTTGKLSIEERREAFAEIPCRKMLSYLAAGLADRQERNRALRAAWEVMGDLVLDDLIVLASEDTDSTFGKLAADALSDKLVPYIARSAAKEGSRVAKLTLAVADHLDELEQVQLFSKVVDQLGSETPWAITMRLAGHSSVMALRVLREWLSGAPEAVRAAFAGDLLARDDAARCAITAEIALGAGVWKRTYVHRARALQVLARAGTTRAREVLDEVGRSARWSLSGKRRALAGHAREQLAAVRNSGKET